MFCPNCGHKLSDRRFNWAVAIGLIAIIVLAVFLSQSRSQVNSLEDDIQLLESRLAQAETETAEIDNLCMYDNTYFDYRIYFPGSWRMYGEHYVPGGFPIGWGTDWHFFGDPFSSWFANYDRHAHITIYGCDLTEEYTHPVGLDYEVQYFISWLEDEWDGEVMHSSPAPQGSRWDWIVSFKYSEDYGGYLDEPLEMTGEAYFLETPDAIFRIDWQTGDGSYTDTCQRIAESFTLY
jgi:hypothetical protein